MHRKIVSAGLMLYCCAATMFAGQVTLKNGDRLTGEIVKADGKVLVIKSEFAGEVSIKWDAISAIQSEKPLNVALGDNQLVIGPVTTQNDQIQVQTKTAGTI